MKSRLLKTMIMKGVALSGLESDQPGNFAIGSDLCANDEAAKRDLEAAVLLRAALESNRSILADVVSLDLKKFFDGRFFNKVSELR